jgi:hypothetical protein
MRKAGPVARALRRRPLRALCDRLSRPNPELRRPDDLMPVISTMTVGLIGVVLLAWSY